MRRGLSDLRWEIDALEGPGRSDLPPASLALLLSSAADKTLEETERENVILLDRREHYLPDAVRELLENMADRA